jgi:hypothetical protein
LQKIDQVLHLLRGEIHLKSVVVEGVSGATPHYQRPAFKKLLAALYGNGVRDVVVESSRR